MAVVRMKKAYLLAHSGCQKEIVDTLQEQGLLHMVNLREQVEGTELEEALVDFQSNLKELDKLLNNVRFALDFLTPFREGKSGSFGGLIKEKIEIERAKFHAIEEKIDFQEVYEKCSRLDHRLNEVNNKLAHLRSLRQSLEPWISLDLGLGEIGETEATSIEIGFVPSSGFAPLQSELAESVEESEIFVISEGREATNVLIIIHKSRAEEAQNGLIQYGYHNVSFPDLKSTPKEEIERIIGQIEESKKEREELVLEAKSLLFLRSDLIVLSERLENERLKAEVQTSFAQTQETFMLEGWVAETDTRHLEDAVSSISDEIELTFIEVTKEDDPPIALNNKPILKPFEALTKLYGMPDYGELDPTPFMAPFFFLFFGMCLGDFGYGVVLIALCLMMSKKLQVSENVKGFFHLIAYGGLASMIVGVLTGSYFTIDPVSLPSFLRSLMIIDPLAEAQTFLGFSILLGILHVIFGVVLSVINKIRNQQFIEVVHGELSTLLFIPSVLILLVCMMVQTIGESTPAWVKSLSLISMSATIVTTLLVIVFQGRVVDQIVATFVDLVENLNQGKFVRVLYDHLPGILFVLLFAFWLVAGFFSPGLSPLSLRLLLIVGFLGLLISSSTRKIIVRFLSGLYSLYGMSGFLGDFLSYARLMALGLSTFLIGWTVNMLGVMLLGIPYVGIIIGAVLLVFGHAFNLAINLLGAFIHPLRLQYVEFFKYFYSDGGDKFEPFALQTKHLILK